MGKTEDKWNANYDALKAFVETYRHLPNKKKVENRGLLNWWKYNQRLIKQGKLAVERVQLLSELGATDKPCGEGVRTLTQNCC